MLKVIVVGSTEIASSLMLGTEEAGHKIVGFMRYERVSSNPVARFFKDIFAPTDFFMLAKSKKYHEIKVKSVNSEAFRRAVRRLNADIVLVGTWGEKFSQKTINTPKFATINCHPSMLPSHRGPNPYMSTIVNGEANTGVTFHLMDKSFDTGNILWQKEVPVLDSDNGYTLKLRCAKTAREELPQFLKALEHNEITPKEQNEAISSYYKRITPDDIYIDFGMTSTEIYNKVRGFYPWANCYLQVKGEFLKVGHAQIVDLNSACFFVKNKKYRLPDRYIDAKPARILAKGKDWLLCSTVDSPNAILLYDLRWFGFLKHFLTKQFISSLKSLKK